MSEYQKIYSTRPILHLGLVALAYGLGRYKKINGLKKITGGIAASALAQSLSPKTRNVLGQRTWQSGLIDTFSLCCIGGTFYLSSLPRRIKSIAGSTLFGTQLLISNVFASVGSMNTKEGCDEVWNKLQELFAEDPKEGPLKSDPFLQLERLDVFMKNALPIYDHLLTSTAIQQVSRQITFYLEKIDGWKKAEVLMKLIETIDDANARHEPLFKQLEGISLETSEQILVNNWMNTKGNKIKKSWEEEKK